MRESSRAQGAHGTLLLILVGINIALQLINASLIKRAAELGTSKPASVALILAIVMTLSFGRFAAWNEMHRRYPVSVAYPATALFFPCLVLLAYLLGEVVRPHQVVGVALVTIGVVLLIGSAPASEEAL